MFTRLTFVLCVITGCLADRNIPKNLLFGAATASYQIEGAWNEDGKGVNIWDTFLHDADRENGDVACDSYHKWEEDIANAKALGLDLYRFSISWARILPNGTLNSVNQKGIDYYHNLIQGLLAVGIEPLVTIYHWDLPQHLSDLGGFLNPQLVDYFEDYARILYTEYGPYVKHWITINEPYSICAGGYGGGLIAPGLHLNGDGIYQCSYVLLKAHARAYRIYQEEFKSKYNGQIGISLVTNWYEPATDTTEDLEAQERAFQFIFGWFANPIFLGNWPQIMIDRIANRSALEGLARSRLPEFTQEEIDYINGTHDFFALNTYKVLDAFSTEHPISYPDYSFDMGASWDNLTFNPQGFRKLLNAINDRYHPDSIIITENGIVTEDITDDQERITYLRKMMFRFFAFAALCVALCAAGRRTSTPRHVVPEQQAQASGHYEQISSGGYEQEYESGHGAVDESKESSGAELTSLAHTSAVQAKNAVQSQHTAGSQAAFGIKSTLATSAQSSAQTAQAALVGKQAIVYSLKKQVGEAEKRLQSEVAQYHQTEQAAEIAHQAAQQAQSQIATLSAALTSAQSGSQLAAKAAAETATVAASQQSMVAHAKQRLSTLIHQLQEAVHELSETEALYYKAAEAAQIAQSNAAAAGAAVVAASSKSEQQSGSSGGHYGHH